jgi:CBS domain-containing protein
MNIESILAAKGRAVRTISARTKVREAMALMTRQRMSALVVSEDGTTVDGIVSDRGVLHALVEQGTEVLDRTIGEIMTREVFTCSRGDSVGAVMAVMTQRRIRHIPVVEQDGKLCGIVSIGDVVKHHLDEIQHEAAEMREYISTSW